MDYEQFLKLFASHRDRIYAYAFSLLPNHADAEDVFQKSSIVMWRKIGQLDEAKHFFTWACAIVQFEVRNHSSRLGRERLTFSSDMLAKLGEELSSRTMCASSQLDALRKCVERLPKADRQLIEALYHEHSPLEKLAIEQGKALQTIYNRASLLRQRLANCVRRQLSMELGE